LMLECLHLSHTTLLEPLYYDGCTTLQFRCC